MAVAFGSLFNRTTNKPLDDSSKFETYEDVREFWHTFGTLYVALIISIGVEIYVIESLPEDPAIDLSESSGLHLRRIGTTTTITTISSASLFEGLSLTVGEIIYVDTTFTSGDKQYAAHQFYSFDGEEWTTAYVLPGYVVVADINERDLLTPSAGTIAYVLDEQLEYRAVYTDGELTWVEVPYLHIKSRKVSDWANIQRTYSLVVLTQAEYDSLTTFDPLTLYYIKGEDTEDPETGELVPPKLILNGLQGPMGPQGKSAYQSWLDLGNTGTEEEFINSLKSEAVITFSEWVGTLEDFDALDKLDSHTTYYITS